MRWALVVVVVALLLGPGGPAEAEVPARPGPDRPREAAALTPLEEWLATQPAVRRQALLTDVPRGLVRCAVRPLGSEPATRTRYVGLLCGSLTTGPRAELTSGSYLPAAVRPGRVRVGVRSLPRPVRAAFRASQGGGGDLVGRLLASVRGLPPTCRAADLAAVQLGPGGSAGGTSRTPVTVTNQGADCLLTTGSLTLWRGAVQPVVLDLADRRDAVPLPAGATYRLAASVPDDGCLATVPGAAVLGLGGPDAQEPEVAVAGSVVPGGYAACPGVRFSGAARRAAPSR